METNMVLALLIIALFAVLIGLRVFALIGRDGAVHYAVPGIRRASAYRKSLERKFGLHR